MLNWSEIDTVLLDMDGTLLDLHFDNHFWLHHLPRRWVDIHGGDVDTAKAELKAAYDQLTGKIEWYCLDYWQQRLQLPIVELKREIQHLVQMRSDTAPFLTALTQSGRRVYLVTNAHPDSLSLKLELTTLAQYIPAGNLYSTHQFGVTKESQALWQQLQAHLAFDPTRTLFVDDSLTILHAAAKFGIGHLLAVANPDSQQPCRTIDEFTSTADYRELVEQILAHPVAK